MLAGGHRSYRTGLFAHGVSYLISSTSRAALLLVWQSACATESHALLTPPGLLLAGHRVDGSARGGAVRLRIRFCVANCLRAHGVRVARLLVGVKAAISVIVFLRRLMRAFAAPGAFA